MNILVLSFFVGNVVSSLLLAWKFISKSDSLMKSFGFGLLLNAIAFALWTVGYMSPDLLLNMISLGAISFLGSLVFFVYALFTKSSKATQILTTLFTGIVIIGIFIVGNNSSNSAYISPEGLLFFNLTPLMQMLYIFALSFTVIPLIDLVSSKFTSTYSVLVKYGFIAQVIGGIILITSKDVQALMITGWIVGIIYFILWTTLVFNNKAWSRNN